nr:hypothetical protein BgiMline_016288 [Biomphalaria glabrata]
MFNFRPTKLMSNFRPTKLMSNFRPTKLMSNFRPTKLMSNFRPTKLMSNFRPTKLMSNFRPTKLMSNFRPTKLMSNFRPTKLMSNFRPTKLMSNFRPTKLMSNFRPTKLMSNFRPTKLMSNFRPTKLMSNFRPTKLMSNFRPTKLMSNFRPTKLMSNFFDHGSNCPGSRAMTGYGSFDSKERRSPEGIGKSRRFKKIVRLNYSYSDRPRIPSISVGVAYDIENKPISVNTFGAVLPDVTSEVDLNTASETDIEDSKRYQPNILERALERTICYNFRSREKPSNITVVVLCMLTIISNMAFLILCPMYLLSMRKAGGDAMVAALSLVTVVPLPLVAVSLFLKHIWNKNITLRPNASLPLYSALGASLAIKINITLYASHPARTPTTLQPALSSSFILFSLGAAILILKKECSARRIVCCVVAIVAVLIGIEPKLWSLGGNSDQLFASQYLVERILWPAIYSSSYLPMAIYCAAAESELKKNVVHPFSLSTSGLLSSCVFTVLLSGTNFLPWYGYVNDWPEMWDNFKSGYKCNFK